MVDVPKALVDFIKNGTSFVVAGHEEPDGDCVGSQLALCSLLERMGKKAVPCSAGPFKRNELKPFEKYFLPFPANREGLKVFIMDCSIRDRVGDLPIDGLPTAVVDHHALGNPSGEVIFLDPLAPSVTFMTEKIFRALGFEPNANEAELLLFGLCTDTGFFRHLDEPCAETFFTAARLAAAGASPKKIYNIINGGKSLNSRLLMGSYLNRTKSYFDGKLLVSFETPEESKRYGFESRDSDVLYQLLLSVEGVEAIALIRQENSTECSIGFRSRGRIDVAAIAGQFGGGGHKNAAGAKAQGSIPELEEKIVAAFAKSF
ncbi:MAG: bifunctional oligoribonuclease/PAP phosphatase NrnA [Treponema sp.]|nr:bifunctional oligoribonuclease/PAP phosphatase NrnA [Treponema sp.]